MDELHRVLRTHAAAYPLMLPCDAVKLIYQNEFGGGHLVTDAAKSLQRLENEYQNVAHREGTPLCESIGNGLVRLNLAAVDTASLPLSRINDMFIQSAGLIRGTLGEFKEKLGLLRNLAAQGIFAFTLPELEQYLDGYAASGYPAVSHSEAYRQAYYPAYRIIGSSWFDR